jgi:pre-mRNA-processing factor SLU7
VARAQAEALFWQFKAKKEVLQGQSKEAVMARYGNAAKTGDAEVLALAQSENYVEYNAQARARA